MTLGVLVANCLTLSLRWRVAAAVQVFTHTTVFKTLFTALGNCDGLMHLQVPSTTQKQPSYVLDTLLRLLL